MRVAIYGVGYVGLVTGTCLSDVGHSVTCIDVDKEKIASLKANKITIYEPDLLELFIKNKELGRLVLSTDTDISKIAPDIIMIAVGTSQLEDGSCDLQYVLAVATAIGNSVVAETLVLVKSTVPVKTCFKVQEVINSCLKQRGMVISVDVASNPEFLREGCAVDDFMYPDRIIAGVTRQASVELLVKLYHPIVKHQTKKLLITDTISSEMIKYASNAMLANRISFINMISQFTSKIGGNIDDIARGIGLDSRIGTAFLQSGCGYGGSCFPKDVKALIKSLQQADVNTDLITAGENINKQQKNIILDEVSKHFNGNLKNKQIAVWGLAFKANTDDVREAASFLFIRKAIAAGANIVAYDPQAIENFAAVIKGKIPENKIKFSLDPISICEHADALVLFTEWPVFRDIEPQRLHGVVNNKVLLDGRRFLDHKKWLNEQWTCYIIGEGWRKNV